METYDREYLMVPDSSNRGAYSKLRSKCTAPKEAEFELFV